MQKKNQVSLFVFVIGLLFLVNTIRSGLLVDRSFLPRFLLLSLLLLGIYIYRLREGISPGKKLYEFIFLVFYGWNLLSCTWAVSASETLMQAQLVFLSFAVFLMVSAFLDKEYHFREIFIKTHLIVLLFSFVLAFYRIFSLEFFDPYKILSVSANNNLYSGFLLISLPFVMEGYARFRGIWKYYSAGIATLSIFFIVIVQSRAVYLAFTVSMVLSAVILILKFRRVFSKKNMLVLLCSMLLLSAGVYAFYSSLDVTRKNYFMSKIPVWEYVGSYEHPAVDKIKRQQEISAHSLDHLPAFDYAEDYYENASLRMIFWKKSFCLIQSNPLLGVGAGNWRLRVPACTMPPNPEHTRKNYTYSQPHNEWIGIMSELGLIGLLLSLIVFFLPPGLAFYSIFKSARRTQLSLVFYGCFITGFYLFAFFDFPFRRVEHNVMLFSALAFLMAKIPSRPLAFRFIPAIPKHLFSVLFIFLLIVSVIVGIARISGEYFTVKIFRNERKNDVKVIAYCGKAENIFYRITPNTLPLDWFEGVARYRMGETQTARVCFERALKSTPYEVRVLNDYGAALYGLGNAEKAKAVLRYAIHLDPFFDDARFNLGAIYFFTGRKDSTLFYILPCQDSQKKKDFMEELHPEKGNASDR